MARLFIVGFFILSLTFMCNAQLRDSSAVKRCERDMDSLIQVYNDIPKKYQDMMDKEMLVARGKIEWAQEMWRRAKSDTLTIHNSSKQKEKQK